MNLKRAIEILTESGHRITQSRLNLLKAIFVLTKPFSAHDLLSATARKSSKTDLVTVYRNLHAFEKSGIICRADFSDEATRYMVSEPGHDHHHHHIICRECHKVEALDFCILERQEQLLKKLGFKDISHRLEFSGVCEACA